MVSARIDMGAVLDDLATKLVDDHGTPNVFFVNLNGEVVGVLMSEVAALTAAKTYGEAQSVFVEDRIRGVAWGNRRYWRAAKAETDAEAELISGGGGASARNARRSTRPGKTRSLRGARR